MVALQVFCIAAKHCSIAVFCIAAPSLVVSFSPGSGGSIPASGAATASYSTGLSIASV